MSSPDEVKGSAQVPQRGVTTQVGHGLPGSGQAVTGSPGVLRISYVAQIAIPLKSNIGDKKNALTQTRKNPH